MAAPADFGIYEGPGVNPTRTLRDSTGFVIESCPISQSAHFLLGGPTLATEVGLPQQVSLGCVSWSQKLVLAALKAGRAPLHPTVPDAHGCGSCATMDREKTSSGGATDDS